MLPAMLTAMSGCQSTHDEAAVVALAKDVAKRTTVATAYAEMTQSAPTEIGPAERFASTHDDLLSSTPTAHAEVSADGPRPLALAFDHEVILADYSPDSAMSRGSLEPGDRLAASEATTLAISFSSLQESSNAEGESGAAAGDSAPPAKKGDSLEEINNKLNNPGADLAQLNFKFNWNKFKGRLGGASSQNSLTMDFQPVFPFKLGDGGNLILRPTIPVVWEPSYNARARGFDENFGLGDSQFDVFYSRTDMKKGYMWGAGTAMQFPTHTDDSLGTNQFQMGPAGFVGLLGKWGSAGVFPQHFWNIGGSDEGYTALTVVQPFYWFNVGGGYQIGGSPAIEYNWAQNDSDEAWTVPVNLGVAKTIMVGKMPVKIKLEAIYYIEQPEGFGQDWGLQLTFTPVIPNPFEAHASK